MNDSCSETIFDISEVAFSRYGSYIAFSYLPAGEGREGGLYLRTVRGPAIMGPNPFQEVFRIELLEAGQPVPFTTNASPTVLRLDAEGGFAQICLPEPSVVRVRCAGLGVRFSRTPRGDDNAIRRDGGSMPSGRARWQVSVTGLCEVKYMLTALQGRLEVDAPWDVVCSTRIIIDLLPDPVTGFGELVLEEFLTVYKPGEHTVSFDACLDALADEYAGWRAGMPAVPDAYAEAARQASYYIWSCAVLPSGHLTRPAIYMSKRWMVSIWSWDNCFNALALMYGHPDLAWDQFMIPIDKQDRHGMFPDLLNDRMGVWGFNKPPVQGWALWQMMQRTDIVNRARLEEVYEPLCHWTEWWFTYRDDDGDGVPQYNHGNDSGWDNASVFATRPPIESPDLSAYLVIQMDVLAEIARRLGREEDARRWQARAGELLDRMLSHFWRRDRFVVCRPGDHRAVESNSLLLYVPLMLGRRLPPKIAAALVAGLKEEGQFLTAHGLATERVTSPLHKPNGYWRGPIWGSPIALITDGLVAIGERAFACEVRRRFCDTVARSGIAENYEALTGEGLRERGFTWTSSIFLYLAHELGEGR